MSQQALFISDLHLSAERPDTNQQFFRFLADEAARSQALYVLGDLFEYWAGDDELKDAAGDPLAAEVASGFKALSKKGVKIWIMHGNRDFLVGKGFLSASGAQFLDDPSVIRIAGKRVALLHGDTLCTDDHDYQAWRRIARVFAGQPATVERAVDESPRADSGQRPQGCGTERGEPLAMQHVEQDISQFEFDRDRQQLARAEQPQRLGRFVRIASEVVPLRQTGRRAQ